MIEGGAADAFTKTVPANSRESFNMSDRHRSNGRLHQGGLKHPGHPRAGHVPQQPQGGPRLHRHHHPRKGLLPGRRRDGYDWGFTTYVLVQNPQNEPHGRHHHLHDPDGPGRRPLLHHAGQLAKDHKGERPALPQTPTSPPRCTALKPIIAERAMYWDNGTGEACHDSIGMSAPAHDLLPPRRADLRRQGDLDAGAEPQRRLGERDRSPTCPPEGAHRSPSPTRSPPTPARPTTWPTRSPREGPPSWSSPWTGHARSWSRGPCTGRTDQRERTLLGEQSSGDMGDMLQLGSKPVAVSRNSGLIGRGLYLSFGAITPFRGGGSGIRTHETPHGI